MKEYGLSVGVLHWQESDGIALPISSMLEELGCQVVKLLFDQTLPENLDAIVAYGPFKSLVPLANQLVRRPKATRPRLAFWLTEPLPNPSMPELVRCPLSAMRSMADRCAYREQRPGVWRLDPRLKWLTSRGKRFRYYGDLFWLRQQGILSLLVVGSKFWAAFLSARGFSPFTAYIGSHRDWGADLGLDRDIPVLWLGKIATRRRKHLLQYIRSELGKRGIEVLVIDGVENPYVFGEERTILLNRTVIALNLLRQEYDNNGLRYYLAAPNRALIVTEPTLAHTPFSPGTHLVETPVEQMADTICYYLSHEEERMRIADNAYQLVTTDLTMRGSVERVLERLILTRETACERGPLQQSE